MIPLLYLDNITNAVDLIERNLTEPLSVGQIADEAHYSKYHFQRLFQLVTNETVGTYIRKRRLAEAAKELVQSAKPILEIALEYQFQSQEAFTRSFRSEFRITPYQFRKRGVLSGLLLKRPHANDSIRHIVGEISQNPEEMSFPELNLTGIHYTGQGHQEIKKTWQIFLDNIGSVPRPQRENEYFGYTWFEEQDLANGEFHYLASVCSKEAPNWPENIPGRTLSKTLPPSRYLAFSHSGPPETIPYTFQYIFGIFLPDAGLIDDISYHINYYDLRYKTFTTFPVTDFKILIPLKTG